MIRRLPNSKNLTPAIVPGRAGVAAGHRLPRVKDGLFKKAPQLGARIKMHLARRSQQRMPMEDYHFFSIRAGHLLEAFAQIEFLRRKKFRAESPDLPKSLGLAKDKGPWRPLGDATHEIPQSSAEVGQEMPFIHANGAAAGKA